MQIIPLTSNLRLPRNVERADGFLLFPKEAFSLGLDIWKNEGGQQIEINVLVVHTTQLRPVYGIGAIKAARDGVEIDGIANEQDYNAFISARDTLVQQRNAKSTEVLSARTTLKNKRADLEALQLEIKSLRMDLRTLIEELQALSDGGGAPSEITAKQAEISAKQAEVTLKEEEIEDKTTEFNTALQLFRFLESELKGLIQQLQSLTPVQPIPIIGNFYGDVAPLLNGGELDHDGLDWLRGQKINGSELGTIF